MSHNPRGDGNGRPLNKNNPPAYGGYYNGGFGNPGAGNRQQQYGQQIMYPAYGSYMLVPGAQTTYAPTAGPVRAAPTNPVEQPIYYGGVKYKFVETLQDETNDPYRMSNGVRVLRNCATGILAVEKYVITTNPDAHARTQSEIACLLQIRKAGGSPNVNAIRDAFWSHGSITCVLLLEYCDKRTLADTMKNRQAGTPISENFCWHVLEGLTSALTMIHYGIHNPDAGIKYQPRNWNTIVHLDIKPANVFLSRQQMPGFETTEDRIVLGDFGCAVTKNDIETGRHQPGKLQCMTPGWVPPEIRRSQNGEFVGDFGKPMDIWQIGGVVQCLCRNIVEPDMRSLKEGRPCGSRFSTELNKVVCMAMTADKMARPTALDLWTEIKMYKAQWVKKQKKS